MIACSDFLQEESGMRVEPSAYWSAVAFTIYTSNEQLILKAP